MCFTRFHPIVPRHQLCLLTKCVYVSTLKIDGYLRVQIPSIPIKQLSYRTTLLNIKDMQAAGRLVKSVNVTEKNGSLQRKELEERNFFQGSLETWDVKCVHPF